MQSPDADADARSWNRGDWMCAAFVALCTFLLYFPTRHFNFIEFDDHLYVYSNVRVLSGLSPATLRWAMTAIVVANWHPLTIITELIIVSLFGPSAGAFHLTNAVLHALNVALLYAFFRRSTRRPWAAFFIAGLWGLHSLRVESVAWISELKDVLCGALWLGGMLVYLRYARQRTLGRYLLVLAFQALALTAKPMAATLPGALLLLDYWPLRFTLWQRADLKWWTARILEKLPLLALAVADIAYAIHTQGGLGVKIPMKLRLQNVPVSYVLYLRDIFFPRHLLIFYPHPALMNQTIPLLNVGLCTALLLLVTILALVQAKARPYLLVGWLWFLGTLIPVIGLIPLGDAARADRYTYLPSIGITIAVVWFIAELTAKRQLLRNAAAAGGLFAMAALSFATANTVPHWRDTRSLFDYARSVDPENVMALTMYCNELWQAGAVPHALEVGKHMVTIAPSSGSAHAAYALALQRDGQFNQAWEEMAAAVRLEPTDDDYWDGLGWIRDSQAAKCAAHHDPAEKDFREKAINDFNTALKINPDSVDAQEHLAFELAAMGRLDQAIAVWKKLLSVLPGFPKGQGDLADALRLKGDIPGAVEHFQAAINLGAKNPSWESQLAYLVATNPQATPADVQPLVSIAKDACDQTRNTDAGALDAYAACLARVGRFDDAVTAAKQGIDQANAAKAPLVAAGIKKRLAKYELGLPWVAGD